jgi:hypothetical protein
MFHRNAFTPAATRASDTPLCAQSVSPPGDPTTLALHYPSTPIVSGASQPILDHHFDREISVKLTTLHQARHALAMLLLNRPTTASDELRSEIAHSTFVRASDLFHIRCHSKKEERIHRHPLETPTNLEQQVSRLEHEIFDIVEARNSDPELTRQICRERGIKVAEAKAFLASLESLQLLFTVEGIGLRVGGIVGRAMLMIEALLSELPNARVHVHSNEKIFSAAGAVFGSAAEGRLTMGQFPNENAGASEQHRADMVVSVAGSLPSSTHNRPTARVALYPFAYVQRLGSLEWLGAPETPELTPALHESPVCNDLHNPRGTVILDRGLYKARQQRDNWDLSRLKHERRAWRTAVIAEPCNALLDVVAAREGWCVDEAIWSMCYIWYTAKLTKELLALSSFIRDNPHALPSHDPARPPHIVIHTRATAWGCFKHMCSSLPDAGIRIIDATPPIVQHVNPDVPPRITLVTHSAIDNVYMRQALTQLVGCPVRDSTNTRWIDFPVYVTGSASWLESVSAGGIALHDDTDTLSGKKCGQIASLLLKQRILAGEDLSSSSWSTAHRDMMSEASRHILGSDPDGNRYRNLERLSAQARAFTDALYQLNSVDDLIIALADMARKNRI